MERHGESSPQEIAEALFQRAVALWGPERAKDLRPALKHAADQLWTLSQHTPGVEVEPAFFL